MFPETAYPKPTRLPAPTVSMGTVSALHLLLSLGLRVLTLVIHLLALLSQSD